MTPHGWDDSSWPDHDYLLGCGQASQHTTEDDDEPPKPKHPIGFALPKAPRRTRRPHKSAAKGKSPKRRQRKA